MKTIADYARIFETGTSDDWVEKRNNATTDVRAWLEGLSCSKVIVIASDLADSLADGTALPDAVANEVAAKIRAYAPSFVRSADQGDLQIKVVTSAAALMLVTSGTEAGGWKPADALAAGLWSALWFQRALSETKLEELRSDLLAASRERVLQVAELARKRRPVPAIAAISIDQNSAAGAKVNNAFSRAVEPMVSAMRDNAALDREELDFMWWLLSERSDLLEESTVNMADATRAVVCGLDAAAKLRRLPANAHRDIVLRKVTNTEPLSLNELIDQLGERRARIAGGLGAPMSDASAVFPLISAIAAGASKHAFCTEKLSPSEWGARALLEGAIHHLQPGTRTL